jgi:N-acetyl-anhydromuramyl-L-alanine amidase AmpD
MRCCAVVLTPTMTPSSVLSLVAMGSFLVAQCDRYYAITVMTSKGVVVSLWVPSPNFHAGRRAPLKWIVWHSTESNETTGGAYNVAAGWFAKPGSRVSAHIVVDDGGDPRYRDGVVECVKPGNTAWHAARANASGYGIEIVGKAGQGQGWNDAYSMAAVRNACAWIAHAPELARIPASWLSDQQLDQGKSGHITHAQVSRVLGGTTHTDPGPNFPRQYVMDCLDGPAPAPVKSLQVGDEGPQVRDLQDELNRTFPSYSSLDVDGVFGPATKAVVSEFQYRTGIAVDGIVGPTTRRELGKHGIVV